MIRASYNRNTASGAWIYPIPPDASPETVDWQAFLGPAKKRPYDLKRFFRWRCYRDYAGGIATDLFVHLCTTIHFIMDAKAPSTVVGAGRAVSLERSRDVPDTLNAILEYPEGFTVNLSSTFNNQFSGGQSFQILGTEGTLVIGSSKLTFVPNRGQEDNRWIVEAWPRELEQQYYQDEKVRAAELPQTRKTVLAAQSGRVPADRPERHGSALSEFLRLGAQPQTDNRGRDGRSSGGGVRALDQ